MANPQPDIFLKWSKELWKALAKKKIPSRARQVFDAIAMLTYGQIPPVKEKQISNQEIMKLTGLNSNQTAKGIGQLLSMNIIAKNGNYYPRSIGINKDYDSWKLLPKMAKSSNDKALQEVPKKIIAKNGKNFSQKRLKPKKRTLYNTREREYVDLLYEFYKNEINPLRKTKKAAQKNIAFYLKEYSFEDLKKCILNYKISAIKSESQYRKNPSNFFGRTGDSERYFEDYLPKNFKDTRYTKPKDFVPPERMEELHR
jgi:phage replication O-like protein O